MTQLLDGGPDSAKAKELKQLYAKCRDQAKQPFRKVMGEVFLEGIAKERVRKMITTPLPVNCGELVELVKRASDRLTRQVLVARWLHHQGACDADEFLPRGIITDLWKSRRNDLAKRGFSAADWDWYLQIRAWLPYVEAILKDYRDLPPAERKLELLLKRGYKEALILCLSSGIQRKRSPVSVIAAWFDRKRRGDAKAIQNAYYRINRYRPTTQPIQDKPNSPQ